MKIIEDRMCDNLNRIKLITDSSCDLPKELIEKYNICVVPLNVLFGEECYTDGIDNYSFYEKMKASKELPKTASPSPDKFIKEFACEAENILIITISSGLSSTYNNALIGKNMYLEDHKEKRIEIIDSLSGSMGVGLLVLKAAKMIKEKKDLDHIVKVINEDAQKSFTYVALNTIENAVKAGRISSFKGKIAEVLNLKVIVQVEDGLVKVFDKARGERKTLSKLIQIIEDTGVNTSEKILAIAHANALDKALALKDMILKKHTFEEVIISQIGAVIGTYASDGAVLISF